MSAPAKVLELLSDDLGVYGLAFGRKLQDSVCLRPDKLTVPIVREVRESGEVSDREFRECRTVREIEGVLLHAVPRSRKKSNLLENTIRTEAFNARASELSLTAPLNRCSKDSPEENAAQRRRYHGHRNRVNAMFTVLWKRVLESADQDALKLARRFAPSLRMRVYALSATSKRRLQALTAAPVLAAFCHQSGGMPESMARMIEEGAKLREVMEQHGLPWMLRKLLPRAVFLLYRHNTGFDFERTIQFLKFGEQEFHAFLPKTALGQYRFLQALFDARASSGNTSFTRWIARNAPLHLKVSGVEGTRGELYTEIHDLGDWYRDTYRAPDAGPNVLEGGLMSGFSPGLPMPDFGWEHAKRLSAEWHRNIEFRRYKAAQEPFPEPWLPREEFGGYEFIPLQNGNQLVEEGQAMHHCVAMYASRVVGGTSYIYSVRKAGERVGTLELSWLQVRKEFAIGSICVNGVLAPPEGSRALEIAQFRGVCNKDVGSAANRAAKGWLVKNRVDEVSVRALNPYFDQATKTFSPVRDDRPLRNLDLREEGLFEEDAPF